MSPDEPGKDQPEWPCIVTGECFSFCSPDQPGCGDCGRDLDCPDIVPLCDGSIDRCVECLDDRDCKNLFGPVFGECSLGLCVQCQRDEHCPEGQHCDNGWCGHCFDDSDCPESMHCFRDHCAPDEP